LFSHITNDNIYFFLNDLSNRWSSVCCSVMREDSLRSAAKDS